MRGTRPFLYPVKSGPNGCHGGKSGTCCKAGPLFPAHASLRIRAILRQLCLTLTVVHAILRVLLPWVPLGRHTIKALSQRPHGCQVVWPILARMEGV